MPADIASVIAKVEKMFRVRSSYVGTLFRKLDTEKSGFLRRAQFDALLRNFGFLLTQDEVLSVMHHFDPPENGQISLAAFCKAFYAPEDGSCRKVETRALDDNYMELCTIKERQKEEGEATRTAVKKMSALLNARPSIIAKLRVEWGHMIRAGTSRLVSAELLKEVFQRCSVVFELDTYQRVLDTFSRLDSRKPLDLNDFCRYLRASYSDFSASRGDF